MNSANPWNTSNHCSSLLSYSESDGPVECSGARVCLALVREVDLTELLAVAGNFALLGSGYVWLGCMSSFSTVLLTADGGVPGWLYMQARSPDLSPRRLAFDAAWPNVSLRYNLTTHGAYNASTGLPFFGANVYEHTIWDTDYAPVGDRKPDVWGRYVYDTVWLYGEALANMTARGQEANDGAALLDQLLMSDFEGVTGRINFDARSQDRVQDYDLMNVQAAQPPRQCPSPSASSPPSPPNSAFPL